MVNCFGWYVFFRALLAGRNQTFLEILTESKTPPSSPAVPTVMIARCVELELQAMRLYRSLAQRWSSSVSAGAFFTTLSQQEEEHAEVLRLCQVVAECHGWNDALLEQWERQIPRLEETMQRASAELDSIDSVTDALRLVLRIESSEINRVFRGVISASESEFVQKLRVFRESTSRHLHYINEQVSQLDPVLNRDCQKMVSAFSSP